MDFVKAGSLVRGLDTWKNRNALAGMPRILAVESRRLIFWFTSERRPVTVAVIRTRATIFQ